MGIERLSNAALALFAASLLTCLAVDVLMTVFHPHGRGGPFTRVLNRAVWASAKRMMRRMREPTRSTILSFCGPALAPMTIVVWGLWLVLGFALVYMIPGALAQNGPVAFDRGSFSAAVYYSGYVASTLGLGDVVAAQTWVRLVTVAESILGFLLFAIVVTYVLSVYREVQATHALALEIRALREVDGSPCHLDLWDRDMCRGLIRSVEAHGQYPILHFFRPRDPDRSLLLQIAQLVPSTFNGEGPPPRTVNGRLARASIQRFLTELDRCVPRRFRGPQEESREAESAFAARLLAYIGYPSTRPFVRGGP